MDGHGCRITNGAGPHFIMVDGTMIIIMAGSGYLILNGDLHGLTGEELMVIMAGHQWSRESVSA